MISIIVQEDRSGRKLVGYALQGLMAHKASKVHGYVSRLGRGRFGYHPPLAGGFDRPARW